MGEGKRGVGGVERGGSGGEKGRGAAEKERDAANARAVEADHKIASATKERDDALAQLKGLKESEHRVEVLVAENNDLKQKLADAEKTVHVISEDKPKHEQ